MNMEIRCSLYNDHKKAKQGLDQIHSVSEDLYPFLCVCVGQRNIPVDSFQIENKWFDAFHQGRRDF